MSKKNIVSELNIIILILIKDVCLLEHVRLLLQNSEYEHFKDTQKYMLGHNIIHARTQHNTC